MTPSHSCPSHSCQIYSEGDSLKLVFTTAKGNNTVTSFPNNAHGLARLASVLRTREISMAHRAADPLFATPSIPIQSMVEAIKLTTTVKVTDRTKGDREARSTPARKFAAINAIELSILADILDDEIFA
jgi:hypothetical protein